MTKAKLALICFASLIALTGCAAGQQGQGETRSIVVYGVFLESGALNLSSGGEMPSSLFNSFSHTGDSTVTVQPNAEGNASATNSTPVTADVSGLPGM